MKIKNIKTICLLLLQFIVVMLFGFYNYYHPVPDNIENFEHFNFIFNSGVIWGILFGGIIPLLINEI